MTATRHQIQNPMWGFITRYIFWVLLLYVLVYFDAFSPLHVFNTLHTDISIYLTGLWIDAFDIPIEMSQATLIYTHGMQLKILDECNGVAGFLFFLAAIFAYPARKKVKITWIVVGYFIVMIANAIRIDWILYHTIYHPENFTFIHEVVGRYTMALIPLILFYLYTDKIEQ